MLNTKLFSVMFFAVLSLSGSHLAYASCVSDKEDEKDVRSQGLSGIGADVLSAEGLFKKYFDEAQNGDAAAQFHLGALYSAGKGVPQDITEALHYYKLSADQGNASAQSRIGEMYWKSEGVEKDLKKALYYLQLSADQGEISAQYRLGFLYEHEEGVEKDLKKAAYFYKLSAQQGHTFAAYSLGTMAFQGQGIEKDIKEGVYYLELSAKKKNQFAQCYLGKIYLDGSGVEQDIEKGLTYLELSAQQGNQSANLYLGMAYYSGEHVERDLKKAGHCLKVSVDQGNSVAQSLIEKIPYLCREEAKDFLLTTQKNPQMKSILEKLRSVDFQTYEQADIRMQNVYWLKIKDMTGRKLFEAGNKFRTTNPQYAADCYLEAADKGMKSAKTELQNIRKSQRYIALFSFFLQSKDSCRPEKTIEYCIARWDFLEREIKREESERLHKANSPAPRNLTTSVYVSQDTKKTQSSSTRQGAVEAGKNKKKRVNKPELEQDHGRVTKPAPSVDLGSVSSANKENDPKRQSPRGHFSLTGGLSRQEAALSAPVLSLTPVVAPSYGVRTTSATTATAATSTTTTTPQEEVRTVDAPEKKEKRTLRLKNPMKRGVLYAMFKGETKEEKEARRRENRKSRMLGEGLLTPEEDVTTSLMPSLLESQSHFSITESEFDVEESYLSQSEAELDGVEGYVKFYYKPLWRLIHKSRATCLDQVKIKSSSLIRSVLTLMKEKQLITGTVNRGNIHVAKMGDQKAVFVAHTTHGSGAHVRWYEDPAVVVDLLTFWAKSDSNVKLFLESHFGENCFSRDIGADPAEGTTSPDLN